MTRTSKEEPIGVSLYANVYEVIVHGTVCAAKEMNAILSLNETKRRAFLRECVNNHRILHPNVVQFLGVFYPNPNAQLPWLVMELMHTSLTSLIERYEKTDFPICFKLSILIDTCQGLQFLHSQNIIHKNLSSNNILLTKHLVAKIGDLGMSNIIPSGLPRLTQAPGTTAFMPPEALCNDPKYGTSIDVFSVGCVCIHVISLQWPTPLNKIDANKAILSEIKRREIYFASLVKFSSLKLLVEQCLQDEPKNRPVIEEVCKSLKIIDRNHHSPDTDKNIIECIATHHQKVAEYEKLVSDKDKKLIEKDEHLTKKDQLIFQKDQELAQQSQQLNKQDEQLSQEIFRKDEMLKEKDKVILKILEEKDYELKEKDYELKEKDYELKQKDQEISMIESSYQEKIEQLKNQISSYRDHKSEQKDQHSYTSTIKQANVVSYCFLCIMTKFISTKGIMFLFWYELLFL